MLGDRWKLYKETDEHEGDGQDEFHWKDWEYEKSFEGQNSEAEYIKLINNHNEYDNEQESNK